MRIRSSAAARVTCVLVVATPLTVGTLRAQEMPQLERGTRIRFSPLILEQHLPRNGYIGGPAVATVLSTGPDSLDVRVRRGGAAVSLPWSDLQYLERYSGLTRPQATLLGGATVGVVMAALRARSWKAEHCGSGSLFGPVTCKPNPASRTDDALSGFVLGSVAGGLTGFAFSTVGVFERWTPVRLPARVELSRGSDRLGISASVPF